MAEALTFVFTIAFIAGYAVGRHRGFDEGYDSAKRYYDV